MAKPVALRPAHFARLVLDWQHQHGRHDLPWQNPITPYRVLVSEIMLQQTQVATVIPYFERWLTALPDLASLAAAEEDQVMQLWQGLGYYSRARNLQRAARYLLHEHGGEFPADLQQLQQIPGVGPYTAGAIYSFAFDQPGPIVDGNVRRLFCRLFGIHGSPLQSAVNRKLWELARAYTPTENNRAYAQGLLDLGATLCTPRQPDCANCPLTRYCVAYQEGRQQELPTPKPKQAQPVRDGHFIWQEDPTGRVRLVKRPGQGIWSSLWSLPEVAEPPAQAQELGRFRHTFTHYKLAATVWQLTTSQAAPESRQSTQIAEPEPELWVNEAELAQLGLPAPIKKFIRQQQG